MDTTYRSLSDADLLAAFKGCSPKTGERLYLYAELKKRNLLTNLKNKKHLLFRGKAPVGWLTAESIWFLIGCAIVGKVAMRFDSSSLRVWVLYFSVLLALLNVLHLILYKAILIYSDRISLDTCLSFDWLRLKSKTIQFGEQGLYINTYCYQHFILSLLLPKIGFIKLRAIPNVDLHLRCELSLKAANNLLAQLKVFFEAIEQDAFIESNSPEISLLTLAPLTDLKSFCLRQAEVIAQSDSATADVNWLRLIDTISDRSIPERVQSLPLSQRPYWLEPKEHLVLCLSTCLKGFRNKGYLWLTNDRVVWTTLSGDYINGTMYGDDILKPYYPHANSSIWLVSFEKSHTVKRVDGPYPLSSIFAYFTNRRLCK